MATFLKLNAHLNHPIGGATETFFLATQENSTAIEWALEYLEIRRRLLGSDCTVAGMSITRTGQPPNSICLPFNFPLARIAAPAMANPFLPPPGGNGGGNLPGGIPVDQDAVNTVQAGIQIRFTSTFEGRFGNRIVRLIPDIWVNNAKFTVQIVGIELTPGNPIPAVGQLVNIPVTIRAYIQWVLNRTGHTYRTDPEDPDSLTQVAWESACVIRPTTKRVGRPFGPFRGRRARQTVPS